MTSKSLWTPLDLEEFEGMYEVRKDGAVKALCSGRLVVPFMRAGNWKFNLRKKRKQYFKHISAQEIFDLAGVDVQADDLHMPWLRGVSSSHNSKVEYAKDKRRRAGEERQERKSWSGFFPCPWGTGVQIHGQERHTLDRNATAWTVNVDVGF